jgi:hypothetical protein
MDELIDAQRITEALGFAVFCAEYFSREVAQSETITQKLETLRRLHLEAAAEQRDLSRDFDNALRM